MKAAAIAYIRGQQGILSVWNKRFNGYTLPGGKIEDGEGALDALIRELKEEVNLGIDTFYTDMIWEEWIEDDENEPRFIIIFQPWILGTPISMEEGCPIKWLTEDEFTDKTICPFFDINKRMLERLRLRSKLGY